MTKSAKIAAPAEQDYEEELSFTYKLFEVISIIGSTLTLTTK